MLHVPDLPEKHCVDATIAQLFIVESAHTIEHDLAVGIDPLTNAPLTERQVVGKQMRLKLAGEYLGEHVLDCMNCQVFEDHSTEGCPNASVFGFVREILL